MNVIALVGMPGAGKTVAADHLRERGYPVIRFGESVVNEILRRGLPLNPENEQQVRSELRQVHGMDVMAKMALPLIQAALKRRNPVVVDGLYSFSEYKRLREEFGDSLVVIAIAAPRKVRYLRLASRPVRPFSRKEAEQRDYHEIENIEKGGPIAIADYTVVNDQGTETLQKKIDRLLEQAIET